MRAFLAVIAGHRLAAAFHVALVTGLWRGEVLGLRWEHVDLDGFTLSVSRQLAVERGRPIIKQLKTEASQRVVTFGPTTADVLRRHRVAQEAEAATAQEAWVDSGLVFTTRAQWLDRPATRLHDGDHAS